ncbi:MAG: ribbon-helix-helix protein, CopG family [Proteobacteria bacterium]|nr:ribbon-helix-helix protein, CopG family [Pseudomonadota bacterium]
METSTVNISFKKDLLSQIDEIAGEESRSRSELIREAARMYIERKRKWQRIFEFGEKQALDKGIVEEDIMKEIKTVRGKKRK